MSAYDTVFRDDTVWIRFYCETPMDPPSAVYLHFIGKSQPVHYLTVEEADRIGSALVTAAERARERNP